MRSVSAMGRVAAVGAVIAAIVLVALLLFGGGGDSYTVKARFMNAGQLVKGNPVELGGVPVGSVKDIKITDDGQAEVELSIDDDYAPLRRGTRAVIRQVSQSGIANRYVDLTAARRESGTEHDPGRRRDRHRQDHHRGRPRPALQHARPADAQVAPGLLQGLGRPVRAAWRTRPTSASTT